MKITVDLNVILDVFLKRGDYWGCGKIVTLCEKKICDGYIPSHGIPTIYYILQSNIGREAALEIVDYLIEVMTVVPVGNELLRSARRLSFRDFEDAIVAASAVESKSDFIITKNSKDFADSPVPTITPERFMHEIDLSFGS
jgi:predicted nucleic acid-binding protein